MIDQKIISQAEGRIKLAIEEQSKELARNIEIRKGQMNARGLLMSSNMVQAVVDECVKTIQKRAEIVWSTLHRALTTVGVDYDDAMEKQLNDASAQYFPDPMADIEAHINEITKLMGMPNLAGNVAPQVSAARSSALRLINSEIELFVLALKKESASAVPYAPQIHISNSTIGAFQAGHNSTATITQQVQNAGNEGLLRALEIIEKELHKIDSIPGHDKAEITALVADGKAELVKPSPMLAKLKAYLPVVAESLKVVGDLKPAYETLKSAAQAIGLELP